MLIRFVLSLIVDVVKMNEEEFSELLKMLRFMKANDAKNFDVSRFMSTNFTNEQTKRVEKEFGPVRRAVIDEFGGYSFEADYF